MSRGTKEKASPRAPLAVSLSLSHCLSKHATPLRAWLPLTFVFTLNLYIPLAFVHDFFFSCQVSKAVLGDKKPLTTRPSAALPPADFAAVKAKLQEGKCGQVLGEVTDELVVSSLLYPKVRA